MVDKVKPLKIESTVSGTETDYYPTEMDVAEDYAAVKGIAFENTDTHRLEKLGRDVTVLVPDRSSATTYLANGEIDYIEIFNGATQTTPNRIARVDMTYDGNLNPTSESWKIYDTNGTTILRTIVLNHTFSGADYQSTGSVTT